MSLAGWTRWAAASVLSILVCSGRPDAADWPAWRGPRQDGVSPEPGLPAKLDSKETLRYRVPLPGRGLSSPIVAAGRVFLTASSGWRDDRLHVLAFNAADGRKLWERRFEATGSTFCNSKTCMAAPTPAWDGERLYALFATFDLIALDGEGHVLWCRALGRDYPELSNQVGFASSPAPMKAGVIAILDTDSEALGIAIDGVSGRNLWKQPRERGIQWTSPIVMGGDAPSAIFSSPHGIECREIRTGQALWTWRGGLDAIASPVESGGTIYAPGSELVALASPKSGADPELRWKTNRLKASTASPLVLNGKIFTLNSAGVLACGSAQDGRLLWQERLKGPFSASAVAVAGRIYCVNEEGASFSLDPEIDPRVVVRGEIGEVILASPAVAESSIFLRSDGSLFAFGQAQR